MCVCVCVKTIQQVEHIVEKPLDIKQSTNKYHVQRSNKLE